ncbi:hypothetical protein [Hydrogenophaga sp.]|uniref:hypothetical protein n=1 Tax=Hydrogenophaga sp. TaxID=1904254 RepID=UPI00286DC398|nr:hypothetical protein [Hydrogenophaga sp.]
MRKTPHPSTAWVLTGLMTAVLTACGGGSTDPAATDPDAVVDPAGTITGAVVVNGPVKNAVVCLDLDDDLACDAGEPTSAPTGSDGRYAITYDVTAIPDGARATLSVIAPQVPGALDDNATSIDMADGEAVTEVGFVLRQVPGRRGQINPLTTLLAVGMADGMSEAEARANMAIQLGISADKIDNYQSDPEVTSAVVRDTARTMAAVVAYTMERGRRVWVGRQTAALTGLGEEVRRLQFSDLDNFSLREFSYVDKAEGATGGSLLDRRYRKSGGVEQSGPYDQAYLSPAGWVRCDDVATPLTFTLGVPNRSVYCNAQHSVGARSSEDVGGRAMGDVVNALQSDPQNFINVGLATTGLLASLGSATFPSGSSLGSSFNLDVNQPVYIDSIADNAQPQSRATDLAQLIAARPASGVDLSNAFGSLAMGIYTSDARSLRVAFTGTTSATQGTVQYYACDRSEDGQTHANCDTSPGAGTYTISTQHGVRVMRFGNYPATASGAYRVFVEVQPATQVNAFAGEGNWVYVARENKPDVDNNFFESKRFNGTGWAAMKQQLGL